MLKKHFYRLVLAILFAAGSISLLTSCHSCPDSSWYGEEVIVLSVDTVTDSLNWKEEVRGEWSNLHSLHFDLQQSREDTYLGNEKFFVANTLYDYHSGNEIVLPDSLKECNFGKEENTLICAVTSRHLLYNSFRDTTFYIENGKSMLYEVIGEFSSATFEIQQMNKLEESRAEYVGENKYAISTFHNPTYDIGAEQLYLQRSIEIREFVIDSAGNIVNDILFYRELEQLERVQQSFKTLFSYGDLNKSEAFPAFTSSEELQKYVFSYRGEIYMQDFESENRIKLRTGKDPVLFDGGKKIVYEKEAEGIETYDLVTETHFFVSSASKARNPVTTDKDASVIYYHTDSGIYRFDVEQKMSESIMHVNDYKAARENEMTGGSLFINFDLIELFTTPNKKENLTLLLFSNYDRYESCN